MANTTITLAKSQTRRLTQGTWQAWKAATTNEIIPFYLCPDTPYISYRSASDEEMGCFKLTAVYDLLQRINTVTVTLRFKNTSTNRAITIHPFLRLYNGTDPSGGSVKPGYLPQTGLLATANIDEFSLAAGATVDKSISFTGLSTTIQTFHVLLWPGMMAAKDTNGYIQVLTENCSFTGTGPETVPSITTDPSSVKTGEATSVRIWSRGGRTLNLTAKYGTTVLDTMTITQDITSLTIPKSWFTTAGVTTLKYIEITLELDNGNLWSLYMHAGDDMKPVVGTPSVSIVQPAPASTNYPNTFLAGISKAHVAVAVSPGSNSTIRTVTCSYDGGSMTLTDDNNDGVYEGTTPLPVTQNTKFKVTAVDNRGLSGSNEGGDITVVPYTYPATVVDMTNTYRCNSSGAKADGGSYYRVKATATICTVGALSDNQIVEFVVYKSGDSTEHPLTSGVQSSQINGSLSSGAAYTFYVRLTDRVGNSTLKSFRLEGSRRFIVVQTDGTGTGVGIGKNPRWVGSDLNYVDLNVLSNKESSYETSSGNNLLLSGMRINEMKVGAFHEFISNLFTGGTFGQDFLSIGSAGYTQENGTVWFIKPAADTEWSNMPNTLSGKYWVGVRYVLRKASSTALVIILEWTPQPGRIWINQLHETNGTPEWSGWKYITPTAET